MAGALSCWLREMAVQLRHGGSRLRRHLTRRARVTIDAIKKRLPAIRSQLGKSTSTSSNSRAKACSSASNFPSWTRSLSFSPGTSANLATRRLFSLRTRPMTPKARAPLPCVFFRYSGRRWRSRRFAPRSVDSLRFRSACTAARSRCFASSSSSSVASALVQDRDALTNSRVRAEGSANASVRSFNTSLARMPPVCRAAMSKSSESP